MDRSTIIRVLAALKERCSLGNRGGQDTQELSRRHFLGVGAGLVLGTGLRPSLVDELTSLLNHPGQHVEPHRGESLPLDALFQWEKSKPSLPLAPEKRLFLTFDDGPLFCTARILDLLAATSHKATFFVIGRNLTNRKLRHLAIRALQEGHDIGNHSYTHPEFSRISVKRAEQEIVATHKLIEEVIQEARVDPKRQDRFFRFPYGIGGSWSNYATTQDVLASLDYRIAWWDLDTHDWRMELAWDPRPSRKVVASLQRAKPRDVILLHDRHKTAQHLPEMIRVVDAHQLVSVPLSHYGVRAVESSREEKLTPIHTDTPHRTEPRDLDDILDEFLQSLNPGPRNSDRPTPTDRNAPLSDPLRFW